MGWQAMKGFRLLGCVTHRQGLIAKISICKGAICCFFFFFLVGSLRIKCNNIGKVSWTEEKFKHQIPFYNL